MTYRLEGLDQAIQRIRAADEKLSKRGVRTASRQAMNIVRDAARENARRFDDPETAESIADNIYVHFNSRLSKANGGIAMSVGVRGGARQYAATRENRRAGRVGLTYRTAGSKANPGGDTWYWRFLEFGRGPVNASKRPDGPQALSNAGTGEFFGSSVSSAAAQPFLRPALANNVKRATDRFALVMNRELDKLDGGV